jgi:hypothetical protein
VRRLYERKSNYHSRAKGLGGQAHQDWLDAHPKETLGWRLGCAHDANPIPCTVLDPFLGSGTTAYIARKHGRRSIGIELNPDYCELAARRMQQQSLFALEPQQSLFALEPSLAAKGGLSGGAYNPPGQSPHSNAR